MNETAAWQAIVRRDLESALESPTETPADVWDLLRALGHGRKLARLDTAIAALLRHVEQRAARLTAKVREQVRARLASGLHVERLTAAIANDDPDLAQDALLGVEDALVVLGELGAEDLVARTLRAVEAEFKRHPALCVALAGLATARSTTSTPAADGMWRALLVESKSSIQRVDSLIAQWQQRLDALVSAALSPLIDQLRLGPVVALASHQQPAWDVHCGGVISPGKSLALYLVTSEVPLGERLEKGKDFHFEGDRWTFDGLRLIGASDAALLVAIAEQVPASAGDLESALARATQAGAQVDYRLLSPASAQRP